MTNADHQRPNEPSRLDLFGPLPQEVLERLLRQAAACYHAPYARLSLLGRGGLCLGVGGQSEVRGCLPEDPCCADAFCARVVADAAPLVISDAQGGPGEWPPLPDGRPLRFYAGVPITSPHGQPIGTLAVGGAVPRPAAEIDLTVLSDVAKSVTEQLELRAALHSHHFEQLLLRHISDAVIVFDGRGHLAYLNDAAKRLYEVTEDAIGCEHGELFEYIWLRPQDEAAAWAAVRSNGTWSGEVKYALRGGQIKQVALTITTVIDPAGRRLGTMGTVRDITEEARRREIDANRNVALELVTQGAPLAEVLGQIVHALERQLPGRIVSVARLRDGRLREAAPSRLPRAYVEALEGMAIGPASGPCGSAAYRGESVVVSDIARDEKWAPYREAALAAGLRACWSVPLLAKSRRVLGTLAVHAGQVDFPSEQELERVRDAARFTAVVMERYLAIEELQHLALHDPLTDLPNRTLFRQHLQLALSAAANAGEGVAVGMLDLNNFKSVNDSLGHSAGDALLRAAAVRLRGALPQDVHLSRLSGDEFALLCPGIGAPEDVRQLALLVQEALRPAVCVQQHDIYVAGSLGLALYPDDARCPEELLRLADIAMYRAKRASLPWALFGQGPDAPTPQTIALESDLHKALERGELSVHYQPVVCASTGRPHSVEALLRWTHPQLGDIPPGVFIPIAEQSQLIAALGSWVLREATRQAKAWQTRYPGLRIHMNVNLSARQFTSPQLLEVLRGALSDAALPGEWLEVELTESCLMDVPHAVETLSQFRRLGVRVAIDDFGTGYSNLRYLKSFPAQTLKIDRSFVQDLGEQPGGTNATIVRTILGLASALGMDAVAEGVETEAQAAFLRREGCPYLQGWLYAKPMPAPQLEAWLRARQPSVV